MLINKYGDFLYSENVSLNCDRVNGICFLRVGLGFFSASTTGKELIKEEI